jgi:glycosyltransferase involved in cell wall biosynthesis
MKVLQINAVYQKSSTGRTTAEIHKYMLNNDIISFVAVSELFDVPENAYKISNKFDMKIHAFLSRLLGLQGYFSHISTYNLIRYISKIKPDIIHLRNLHGNYINFKMLLKYAAKHNIAVCITLHDTWFYTGKCCHYLEDNCYKWQSECCNCPALKKHNPSWFFDRSRKMQQDKIKLFSAIPRLGVVGVSKWTTEDAKKSAILKNASFIETIYNWIDLELFKPYVPNNNLPDIDTKNKFVILGVAQGWSPAKGIDVFMELEKIVDDDCIIILVGNSNNYKNSNKLHFVGETDNVQQLADYYNMADVFINPSIQETFGKTTAEALSCGTPVIAFNTTASPELVDTDEKCGYIVNRNIAEEYYDKIQLIKSNSKSYYSQNCRNRAEKYFDKTSNINKYIELYEKLINS